MQQESCVRRNSSGTLRASTYVLISWLFLTTLTGLGIYFSHYEPIEIAGNWVRYYTRDLGVLAITFGANVASFLVWLIAKRKGWIDNLWEHATNALKVHKQNHKQNYKNNKAAYILTLAAGVIISAFIFSLFISLVFFNNASPLQGIVIDIRFQLVVAFAAIVVIFGLYKGISALWNVRYLAKISFCIKLTIAFIFLFILQLQLVRSIYTWITWDVGILIHYAIHSTREAPIEQLYFSIFPNNLMLFFVLHHIIRLFQLVGYQNYLLGLVVVNTILVNIAMLASILTVRKIYPSHNRAILLFILLTFLIGLSPWLIVPYSDTFLMPIISLLILTGLLTIKAKTNAKRIIFASISGFLIALGWLIKPLVIVIPAAAIAALILYAFSVRRKIKIRNGIITSLAAGVVIFITIGAFNMYTERQNIIIIDETIRTPMSYTIATGLVEQSVSHTRSLYGTWSFDVAGLNHGTTEEKNERFIQFIKGQLSEFGVLGYAEFLFNKARWITSEGHFFWLGEGEVTGVFSNPERNILTNFFYPTGRYYPFYLHGANGIWVVVFGGILIGMLASCITASGKNRLTDNFELFMRLAVFFSIFVLLFTEGRSRYLISFLPIFCVVSAGGYSYFGKFLKTAMQSKNI